MSKVILIYANCVNPTAKGDFALAGKMAVDLVRELRSSGEQIDVVLTSTLDGLPRFVDMYGKPGAYDTIRVFIEGENIGLCALESFDPVKNSVVAFIEANRCKYAPADTLRRVLSPDSVFLFVGAANQSQLSSPLSMMLYTSKLCFEQTKIYDYFSPRSIFMGSTGIGPGRLGLPRIEKAHDLPPLPDKEARLIPQHDYGFMYLAAIDPYKDLKLIVQYMQLTELSEYVLIGDFTSKASDLKTTYEKETSSLPSHKPMPKINIYASLSGQQMRKMVDGASGDLVMSTGVMSTLEAMQDRKLTYYQDLSNNVEFVASYLIAIKSIVSSDTSLFGSMPQLIIDLSNLLFASKPLSQIDMKKTQDLLAISSVKNRLIEANQTIVAQASGQLAPQLLRFIGGAQKTTPSHQLTMACENLRKPGEALNPLIDQALRRAAAWGRLFELKVILRTLPPSDVDKTDATTHRSALLWATLNHHSDCVQELIDANASKDIQDVEGKTPLHYAILQGERAIIKLLVEAGASTEIQDNQHHSPMDCADVGTVHFIENCQSGHRPAKYTRFG